MSFFVGKISIELGNTKVETSWDNVVNPKRNMNCQGFLEVDHLPMHSLIECIRFYIVVSFPIKGVH